jgi:hypothetical protein
MLDTARHPEPSTEGGEESQEILRWRLQNDLRALIKMIQLFNISKMTLPSRCLTFYLLFHVLVFLCLACLLPHSSQPPIGGCLLEVALPPWVIGLQ